ncbi:serine/threonine-protein kinase MPS1 isoform X2 [Magnolia sinica]|uniref:serine/threonine-protein kinase MPS1 isoform X2 n=1 Tax=Magnolia sinica TaxID=86752 RepID=UPI00265A677C|nr:serine/threonine-protein kinase MPS1 isoform X2 [Magnolia sinica]
MERKANLPPINQLGNASRPSSPPPPSDSIRHVQAAFKRQRPIGMLPPNISRARRILVPQPESSKNVAPDASAVGTHNGKGFQQDSEKRRSLAIGQGTVDQRTGVLAVEATVPDDSSLTPPSVTGTITSVHDENVVPLSLQKVESRSAMDHCDISTNRGPDCKSNERISLSCAAVQHSSVDASKKVQLSSVGGASSDCLQDPSHESEYSQRDQVGPTTMNDQGLKQRDFLHTVMSDMSTRSGGTCSLAKNSALRHDRQTMAFVGKDVLHPMTQSSFSGSSCVTTMSVRSVSAPTTNSTTYNPCSHRDGHSHMELDPLDELNLNPQPIIEGGAAPPSGPSLRCLQEAPSRQTSVSTQLSSSAPEASLGLQDHSLLKGQGSIMQESNGLVSGVVDNAKAVHFDEKLAKGKGILGDVSDKQSQALLTKNSSSNVNSEPNQSSSKSEKALSGKGTSAPRKKNYNPDIFFKVNGKLYQKLGKVGSGGSSEVHKVISSDCTIYALKSIKLKGRDYSTAYGFCQEIEYLNKLKGKNNIIQLIDYEVTDKTLLEEVMSGSMTIKDGRIREDGYIYMVLEYGEIDLAHMLAQKWKQMDNSSLQIDDNWLRFYWQQILQAVNTIHEERIVHSDLKPANFLLVKGSLKLIDFGIAKAIMSDTTNIQRDAQVGTLNYMSPEAFMWNEHDANGNTIKCGRPSDIWSLGCILYQMVYGRTPFAEYKTFWAKFKAITDRNHEITYEPVSNPWLLDLMKKCLAWERTERWRIPQLLQHPFLVPPIPPQLPSSRNQYCQLLVQMAEAYRNVPEVSRQCSQLQQLLANLADPST